MSRLVAGGLIGLAAVVGVLVGTLLPAAQAQKEAQQQTSGRYDARTQLVLSGLGGVVIEVTDRQTNTLYLYLAQPDWAKEKEAKAKEPKADEEPFELVSKIDLTSAGQPRLKVTDSRPKDKKGK